MLGWGVIVGAIAGLAAAAFIPRRVRGRLPGYAPAGFRRDCDPTERRHVQKFRRFVLDNFGGTDSGIVRACKIGGPSPHKRGIAWDWSPPVRRGKFDHGTADRLIRFLLDSDKHGRRHARARKLGLSKMIWLRRAWRSAEKKWGPYRGPNPHTDHIHFTFGERTPLATDFADDDADEVLQA